jgi:hypothetical protein
MNRRYMTNPFIPRPKHKEEPVHEEEVKTPLETTHDRRSLMQQQVAIHEPRYNHLYGSDRVLDSWRFRIDEYVSGTLTTSAGAQVTAAVTLANDPYWRLSRWPGARQLFLCLRVFGLCPRTSPATIGTLSCVFQDNFSAKAVPLGIFPSTAGGNDDVVFLLSQIVDPDTLTLGQIQVTLNGSSPSTAVYDWQIGFSAAYLLPELRGYEKSYNDVRGEIERVDHRHRLY